MDEVTAAIQAADEWIETACFTGASDVAVRTLVECFAIKAQAAGREPLSEVEVSGLFWLQSRLTRSKALMDLVLTGRATIGQRPNGEYMFAAR